MLSSKRSISDISVFHDHEVQSILALFLTKPDLYKDYHSQTDRQGYFFAKFRKFAANYYNFAGDESVYFMSTRKDAAGEANICGGGGGKMSGSSSRYFKAKYHQAEESRHSIIDAFAKKYGATFEPGKDPRLFVGVAEIWNKLDHIDEILTNSKWVNIAERAYDDATFETPIPSKLDKCLIPFAIRNKALQKFRSQRQNLTTPIVMVSEDDDDDANLPTQKPVSNIQFVSLTEEELNDW